MCVLFYFSFLRLHVCAYAFESKVHGGSALRPGLGASGLPYYCTPPVTVPTVIWGLAVWWHNNKKKIYALRFPHLEGACDIPHAPIIFRCGVLEFSKISHWNSYGNMLAAAVTWHTPTPHLVVDGPSASLCGEIKQVVGPIFGQLSRSYCKSAFWFSRDSADYLIISCVMSY